MFLLLSSVNFFQNALKPSISMMRIFWDHNLAILVIKGIILWSKGPETDQNGACKYIMKFAKSINKNPILT